MAEAQIRTQNVLLVEDNRGDQALIQVAYENASFEDHDYRVHVLGDGRAAIDYLLSEGSYAGQGSPSLDLILLDINLPQASGFEIARALRDAEAYEDVPVILMTRNPTAADAERAAQLRCRTLVRKPDRPGGFVATIREINAAWLPS